MIDRKTTLFLLILVGILAITVGCQPRKSGCPEGSVRYVAAQPVSGSQAQIAGQPGPLMVDIRGTPIEMDRIVAGPICNDRWKGKIYVACALEIPAWEGEPTFLEGCPLEVAPGSVVYVAAHNDEAFYKGCSCHTGEAPAN